MANTIDKTAIRETFADALRVYRKQNKISQTKMARLLGMTDRSYIELEHGRCCPSAITMLMFMQAIPREGRPRFLDKMLALFG